MTEEKPGLSDNTDSGRLPDASNPKGEGFPQILHDRARESSQDLHKMLLSFSSGLLAVYFIALTATEDAAKPGIQTISATIGLAVTGLAIFSGFLGLHADMKRNYFHAAALQEQDRKRRDVLYKARDRWLWRQHLSITLLNIFFLLGVTSAILYIACRVLKY